MMRSQDRVRRCYAFTSLPIVFRAPAMRLSTCPAALGGMRVPMAHHRVHPVRRSTQPEHTPGNPESTTACTLDFPVSRRIPSGSRVLSFVPVSEQHTAWRAFLSDTQAECPPRRTRTLRVRLEPRTGLGATRPRLPESELRHAWQHQGELHLLSKV